MSAKADTTWTLDEAVALMRGLKPDVERLGFALNLGGGVLFNGSSAHDLDIGIVPANCPGFQKVEGAPFDTHDRQHFNNLMEYLVRGPHGLRFVQIGWWNETMRKVEMRDARNRKIDFFLTTAFLVKW